MNTEQAMTVLRGLIASSLGRKAFDTQAAPNAPVPYHVLATAGQGRGEQPESDDAREETFRLRVTTAAGSPDAARLGGRQVRDRLCPGRTWSEPSPGVRVRWVGRDVDDVDQSITIPGTNTHPAYVVDTYDVHAL